MMANPYFKFKQFTVFHDRSAMKVSTDACLFGAWTASLIEEGGIQRILDIGAGTGLLSLMLAQKTGATIHAVEIDPAAASQARENATASPFANRIEVIEADIRVFRPPGKYDCIVCNPPFYEKELSSPHPQKNIAHHGASLRMNEVLKLITGLLEETGSFFLLLPYKRWNEIEAMLMSRLHIYEAVLVKQSTGYDPFRVMVWGGMKKEKTTVKEIIISNESQQYTDPFVQLLKDYYLYL